ncbi:hypothetical protein GXP71_11415 [Cellulomonas sp. H30R-01]|uniref:hypothetical protein n=1 Tax=Cellulomonas sp. H30R-01 TaxID=2704467 RepID=UPI00138CB979|nr:hypothetical protein [Cellulomonas sp. H30R-01]QHT56632.1 hypothetical protein GXP71_11415 [Cellulomonas sp. H30R-01]
MTTASAALAARPAAGGLGRVAGAHAPDRVAVESPAAVVLRVGAADATLGAGLVLVALGAEHMGHAPVVAVAAVVLGLAQLVWACAALRGPVPLPRAALAVLLVGGAGWLVVQPATGEPLGHADVAVAGLQVGAALLVAGGLRLARDGGARRRAPAGALVQLVALVVGAGLVAAVTVPALAATDAGAHAQPHGSHGLPGLPGLGGHAGHP